jgi:hypothetical protein
VKSPGKIDLVEAVATLGGFATYIVANKMLGREEIMEVNSMRKV